MNKGYRFEDKNFEVSYQTNNSHWVYPGDFQDEDSMPQYRSWTEAPFGYPGQNLEILNSTANEDINF